MNSLKETALKRDLCDEKYGLFGYCFDMSISGLHSASRATTEGRLWWDNSIGTLIVFIAMLEHTLRTCYFQKYRFRTSKVFAFLDVS